MEKDEGQSAKEGQKPMLIRSPFMHIHPPREPKVSVQSFSPTLLVEVEYDQLKYGGCLHLSKLYVWGEKESSTHACSPDLSGVALRGEIRGHMMYA